MLFWLDVFIKMLVMLMLQGLIIISTIYFVLKLCPFQKYRIQIASHHPIYLKEQMLRTLQSYFIYALLFSIITVLSIKFNLYQKFENVDDFNIPNIFVWNILFVIYIDTTFYWSHILMHRVGALYEYHAVHHKFKNITTFSSDAFHIIESCIHIIFFCFFLIVMPWNKFALEAHVFFSLVYNAYIHSGYDLPVQIKNRWFLKYFYSSTHHSIHHYYEDYNFGLFFTFWDKLNNTEKV